MTLKGLVEVALILGSMAVASPGRAANPATYPRTGNNADWKGTLHGPGLVIMGGGADVDSAFVWMHDTITGGAQLAGGDVVVLRATGETAYDSYIIGLASFNSVQTIVIPSPPSHKALAAAAAIVDQAEAV